jgi:methionyl-tRNA synthetase
MANKYYITTTLPYVNAEPHIGFALEIIQADAIARWKKLSGNEVVFNTGTDEHGLKIYRKAIEENKEPQIYVDEYAAKFDALKASLDLSYTHFIRTTNDHHKQAAQEFWRRCLKNGDIYKKTYVTKYCVGCELEKTDSELIDGKCPIHPNLVIESIDEENYFFRFSKYQQPLIDLYDTYTDFVIPNSKLNEIKTFVLNGLEDFSVSRLKTKMPWGVPVPDDSDHVMYVWFDALVNYISTLGWPENENDFSNFWPGYQVAGKDNLRQQTAIWQAMLLSAGLPTTKQIFIHGFITVDGQKISKSLGNVINPLDLVNKYGTDTVRYFLLAKLHPYEDSDFTIEKFEDAYNSDLANGLGNLVSRVAKLGEGLEFPIVDTDFYPEVLNALKEYRFDEALKFIWEKISGLDQLIEQEKPWTKSGDELKEVLDKLVPEIRTIAHNLLPFLPETANNILARYGDKILIETPLFPRLK